MGKQKQIISLLFFFILISLFSVININNVKGLSYYNWVQNPDFQQYVNIAEDGGAESGSWESGVLYGNFSQLGVATISTDNPYAGLYHFDLYNHIATDGVRYNFTYPAEILGADIEEFSFYGDSDGSADYVRITIYYSDSTSDMNQSLVVSDGYAKSNILTTLPNFINPLKYVTAFDIQAFNNVGFDMDNVVFRCGQMGGQETINFYSYPWYCSGSIPLDIGLDTAVGHNEIGSGYIGATEWGSELIQDIPYLDSDQVHYFDLWVYSLLVNNVRLTVVYSDLTVDISYEVIGSGDLGTWTHLIFSGFFDSNKYIIQIQIGLLNQFTTGRINFDEVGLWSEIEFIEEYQRFSFVIVPTPITIVGHQVSCYLQVDYHFFGYLRNSTGGLSENGTFNLVHDLGAESGIVVNGQFNFSIPARTVILGLGFENFGMVVNINTTVEEFTVVIQWVRVSADVEEEEPYEEVLGTTDMTVGQFNYFMFLFLFLFVPSIVMASVMKEIAGIAFCAGLFMMTGIGYMAGIVPLWLLFVLFIANILILFMLFKRGIGGF